MVLMDEIYTRIAEAEKRFEEKVRKEYSEFYSKGYHFYTNKLIKYKEDCVSSLKEKGLDVLIGEVAFDMVGHVISPTCISIFVKDKKNLNF